MKVVIVLGIALLLAAVGGFVGGSMTDARLPDPPAAPAGQAPDPEREMRDSMKAMSAGADIARRRNQNMLIGAGVGLVAGLAVGALAASRMRPRSPASS